jgi:DNA invertase Pin-like site-specific DNA recombinase
VATLTEALGADDDLLVPFPLHRTEIRIGYARVSTGGQNLDRQLDALNVAPGCRRIFADKKSGKNAQVNMVAELRTRGIGFTSLHERLDTTTPGGRLVFHVFAALAEFIRELIVQGTNEGLAAARARGRVGGRPTVVSPDVLRAARDMLPNPENSVETIAKLLGVSVGTLYNHIPDLKELRASRVPAQLGGSAQ